ncbi:MAG: single-stranded DNA-binding protein [Marinifilaceae bacterium]
MVNKVILIGNVGKDPEIKTVGDNKVASFTLATSETFKDKSGERKTVSEWHNIQLWGKVAEIAEKWVKKGSKLYIEGKLRTSSWEKDGNKHYRTEVMANTIQFIGARKEDEQATQQSHEQATYQPQEHVPYPENYDLPF